MFKKDILDDHIVIFLLFISISLINILFSVHFVPIMLVGILFLAFVKMLENKSFYSLLWIIMAFLIVENIQGFKAFSLVFLAFFIYIFIKPNIEHIFSSYDILKKIYIIIFYISIGFLYSFFETFDMLLVSKIIINLILDIVIVVLFI